MVRWDEYAAIALAIGIMGIGSHYLVQPRSAARSFGLPLPGPGATTGWWLRLKGVRDVAAGIAVLAMLGWGGARVAGILLLADVVIPMGDMLTILAAKGSKVHAFAVHGLTALTMIAVASSLIMGGA